MVIYFDVVRGNCLFVALTVCLGLSAGTADGGRYSLPRCHLVDVVQDEQSHKLACVVGKTQPSTKAKAVAVYLTVPATFALDSAVVNTASGRFDVGVASTMSGAGPYILSIDAAKVDCAASGSLVLVIHGDFTTEATVTCPALPLFQPEACSKQ
jgi:hypothetical protein